MYTIPAEKSDQAKLNQKLEALCRSVMRKSVSYLIQTHSEYCAVIELQVSGKRAVGKKTIILYYVEVEGEWIAVCDSVEYHLTTLTEIATVVRKKVQHLTTIVSKI